MTVRIAGLFAGIGGIELGMGMSGHHADLICELNEPAAAVLRSRFDARLVDDVRDLDPREIPEVDLLAGGFPCQDLSQAGRTAGIKGKKSSLVVEMFRIMDGMRPHPEWLLIENVPFMLRLERGRGDALPHPDAGRARFHVGLPGC